MAQVIIKTEYSWFEDIFFPAWEVWDKDKLTEAKARIRNYFDKGGSGFIVKVGKNQDLYIERANDILGPWCFLTEQPVSDEDAEVLTRLFNGSTGKIPFSKLFAELCREEEKAKQ